MRRLGVQTTKDAQPFSPITRRTRRSLRERQQSAIAPITCGTLTVKGWGRYLLADWSAHSESEHAPTGPGRWAIVRELTRRTRGKSLAQIVKELSVYLTGWRGYFDFCETPSMLRDLDQGPGDGCVPSPGSSGNAGLLGSPSCDAAASAGIWRRKPLVARMALGGSATAPRLLSLSRTPSSPRSA